MQSGVLELRTAGVIDYLFGVSTKGPVLTFGLNIKKSKKGNLCPNKLCINLLYCAFSFHAEFKQIFIFLAMSFFIAPKHVALLQHRAVCCPQANISQSKLYKGFVTELCVNAETIVAKPFL